MSNQPPESATQIGALCKAFQLGWKESQPRPIEDFLPQIEQQHRTTLLRELLLLELARRGQTDETLDMAEYVNRFPQYEESVRDAFFQLAAHAPSEDSQVAFDTPDDSSWGTQAPGSLFASCRLLSAVPEKVLRPHMQQRMFSEGELLMRQGEPGDSLMVITEGLVEISVKDAQGERHILDHVSRGEVLGEMALLTQEPRSADAMAARTVRVLELPGQTLHQLARNYPQISVVLSNLVAERLGKYAHDALTDKTLDRFQIKQRLGRGGMGVVYEAVDTTNGARVALKMMSHRLVYCEEALRRFQQEADIIESFEHPNIVRMYGRFAAFHTYFIVLEVCRGRTLTEILQEEGPMEESRARRLLGQLAAALVYAHQAGVIHQDIKPSNMMIGTDDTLKLMDFGLAEPVLETESSGGKVRGTPRYMAPERWLGDRPNEKTDLFSLGCVAYEMLVGAPLLSSNSVAELRTRLVDWEAPDLHKAAPRLSRETCQAIQPMLSRDSANRNVQLEEIAAWADG